MNERVAEQEVSSDKEKKLISAFKSLEVRGTGPLGFIGPARLSSIVPTTRSWHAKKPEMLGTSIRQLIDDEGVDLKVHSFSDKYAILRREHATMLGKPSTREVSGGGRIHDARVAEVIDMSVGRGRILPLLRLEEFNYPPPEQDYVISVAEMARHVQDAVVEFELS